MSTNFGPVNVRFEIEDWNFLCYPKVRLLERPPGMPPVLDHVDAAGGLCFLAPGSVILDRFQPDVAIQQCLDAAISVLNRIASGTHRSQDIASEFLAYWTVGQDPVAFPVLCDELDPSASSASYFVFDGPDGEKLALVAKDLLAAQRVVSGIRGKNLAKGVCRCLLFSSDERPGVTTEPLPDTIKEFFSWVSAWDATLSRDIQGRLGSDKEYLSADVCVIAISTPSGRLGVALPLDRKHRLGYKKTPSHYRQYLHGAGGIARIMRLQFDDIGATYIHSRNLEFPSLEGRRVTLIGCGAIGGYLAQGLVRLGAGTGPNGLLRLIDHGELEPDNLGRHVLGFPYLYRGKAKGLSDELIRQFPYVNVEPSSSLPGLTDRFFATDLIIEATGEEALSILVNAEHAQRRRIPVLYAWVKGNGECVQALWVDSSKHGCFQCLRHGSGAQYRRERFPVLDNAPRSRFRGCSAFTPYAVSAPMSAAALALDMVGDWLRDSVSPRFRTRYLESSEARRVKNQDISPAKLCPACHSLYS